MNQQTLDCEKVYDCEVDCENYTNKNVFCAYLGLPIACVLLTCGLFNVIYKNLYWFCYDYTKGFTISISHEGIIATVLLLIFFIVSLMPILFLFILFLLSVNYYLKLNNEIKKITKYELVKICRKNNLLVLQKEYDETLKISIDNICKINITANNLIRLLIRPRSFANCDGLVTILLNNGEQIKFAITNVNKFIEKFKDYTRLNGNIEQKSFFFVPIKL